MLLDLKASDTVMGGRMLASMLRSNSHNLIADKTDDVSRSSHSDELLP